MVLDILQRFGHELRSLYLALELQDPFRFWHRISQALCLIPNIRRLSIKFPLTGEDDESWADFVIQPNLFPRLENLTELDVCRTEVADNPSPALSLRPLLLAYQDQLAELDLETFVFREDLWESFLFPNLSMLTISFKSDDQPPLTEIFTKVKELDCPQLKTLKFGGEIVFTPEIFLVLNTFRDRLVELVLDSPAGLENIFQVDPMAILDLPKLVRLTMSARNINSELWHVFRIQFPNLQDLQFIKWWIDDDNDPDQELSVNEQQRFFFIFPRLKRITWTEEPTDRERSSSVFTRESHY